MPWVLLALAGIYHGIGNWMAYNRLQDVALMAARQEAASYPIPTARLRAHSLGLNPLLLSFERSEGEGASELTVRYPVQPKWLAMGLLRLGAPGWLTIRQRAWSRPNDLPPPR